MTLKFFVFYFLIKEIFSRTCSFDTESCDCTTVSLNVIQMNCNYRSNNRLIFDFDKISIENKENYSIKLNVRNKFFSDVISSPKNMHTKKLIKSLGLTISSFDVIYLRKNSFYGLSSLTSFTTIDSAYGDVLILQRIENIKNNSFSGLTSLIELRLINIYLKTIEAGAFDNMRRLEILEIKESLIKKFETYLFTGLINLKYLYINFLAPNSLANNKSDFAIEKFQNGLFYNLRTLDKLEFQDHSLKEIELDAFESLENLSVLNIRLNNLTCIQNGVFKNQNQSLKELYLNENLIKVIERKAFLGLGKMIKLYLYKNQITHIDNKTYKDMVDLKELFLYENKIEYVEINSFSSLNKLTDLRLNLNKIKVIEKETFQNLTSLVQLNLFGNDISLIENESFVDMRSLTKIDLFSNKVKFIHQKTFAGLNKLTNINLSQNEIEAIEVLSFVDSPYLIEILLKSNRIKMIPNGLFNNMSNLKVLQLQENEIVQLEPNSLNGLKKLKEIYLYMNRIEEITNGIFSDYSQASLDLSNNRLNKISNVSLKIINSKVLKRLDLSYNYLDGFNENPFVYLTNLLELDMSNNLIKKFGKGFFLDGPYTLKKLNLRDNKLNLIEEGSFKNLKNLLKLNLAENEIEDLTLIKSNLMYLSKLISIDLSFNLIEKINELDFEFSLNLNEINLNSNRVKFINDLAFKNLIKLKSFKIAKNGLSVFEMNILDLRKITALDLSFNQINFESFYEMKSLEAIKLENVTFKQDNISLKMFINSKFTKLIDFSGFTFGNSSNLELFKNLPNLISLELSRTNIDDKLLRQINLLNFPKLTYLDLSWNLITNLDDYEYHFKYMVNLDYLDLSNNLIKTINWHLFYRCGVSNWNNCNGIKNFRLLKYLNLENNQIQGYFNWIFADMNELEVLKFSNNKLIDTMDFNIYQLRAQSTCSNTEFKLKEFYFNSNSLTRIKRFTECTKGLKLLNLDSNQISVIDADSLVYLRNLENFSISNNSLSSISRLTFYNVYSLKYLNLSFNQISYIENETFVSLNKLIVLDLSFNQLVAIRPKLFLGLSLLNDLELNCDVNFNINSHSFSNLTEINNIYFTNISMIFENKCLFLSQFYKRDIKRDIKYENKSKYVFYKSVNLITDTAVNETIVCEFTFNFLQFGLHLKLKKDFENEAFYEKCKETLTVRENTFESNYKKCFKDLLNEEILNELILDSKKNSLTRIFTDYVFYLTMFLLLSLLGPVSCLLCKHLFIYNIQ
jgi:Leucine-rich repeat (LRR) protein